jgi:hypothetical protein
MCPEGELGDIHICTIHALISEKVFKLAEKQGWPSEVVGMLWNRLKNPEEFRKKVDQAILDSRQKKP